MYGPLVGAAGFSIEASQAKQKQILTEKPPGAIPIRAQAQAQAR